MDKRFWDGRGTGSIAARSTKKLRRCVCGCAVSAGTADWSVPAWSENRQSCRGLRARGTRSAVVGVPHDGGNRTLPGALSRVRNQGGESTAVAEQGAVQQALRRGGGVSL